MFRDRTGTFLVPQPRIIGETPHENLIIIRFNEHEDIGHQLAEHPFGKPCKIAFGCLYRGMGIDQHIPLDLRDCLGGPLLEPFLDRAVKGTHLVAVLHDLVVPGNFEHEGAEVD